MMWKPFVFGLIAGVIGSMYIYMKSLPKPSCAEVVADGGTTWMLLNEEELESLENYIWSEEEYEKMLSLMKSFTYLPTGFASAKWN